MGCDLRYYVLLRGGSIRISGMLLALSHVYPEDVASSDGALPKS